jgi:hypothetical protein
MQGPLTRSPTPSKSLTSDIIDYTGAGPGSPSKASTTQPEDELPGDLSEADDTPLNSRCTTFSNINTMAEQSLPKIVLFGDSLTEWSFDRNDDRGFGQAVAEQFKNRARVWNKGKSFVNTQCSSLS